MNTKLSYTIQEACQAIGIGRTSIYKFISAGVLKTFKIGARTLIDANDLKSFVRQAQQEN